MLAPSKPVLKEDIFYYSRRSGWTDNTTHDTHMKCKTCGQKKKPGKNPHVVLAASLCKQWRLIATPLRYKVQRMQTIPATVPGRKAWVDQREHKFPRTRDTFVMEELQAAGCMFDRVVYRHVKEIKAMQAAASALNFPKVDRTWYEEVKEIARDTWHKLRNPPYTVSTWPL